MSATFKEINRYILDVSIIGRKLAVCYRNQQVEILEGTLDEIIFDSIAWNTIIICSDARSKKRFVYNIILNHRLYRELSLIADKKRILAKRNIL